MAKFAGADSLDQLIDQTIPEHLRFKGTVDMPDPIGERDMMKEMVRVGEMNEIYRSFIGQVCPPSVMRPSLSLSLSLSMHLPHSTRHTPFSSVGA